MRTGPVRSSEGQRRHGAWIAAGFLSAAALYPVASEWREARRNAQRLEAVDNALGRSGAVAVPLDPGIALRVTRLDGLLSSWETVGGCGAGSTGGAGVVKWIGRSTTGGLFQSISQFNYIHFSNGYNLVATEQISRDLGEKWNVGVLVPFVYKWYDNYLNITDRPVDLSNSGFGDIQLLGTRRFGAINDTALTLSIGVPTGTSKATYRLDYLTQEKQLGLGPSAGLGGLTASVMVDHTLDETWGLIVLGGVAAWRGGRNDIGNYRAPMATLYGYGGYFMGPFVPALGLSFTGFAKPDQNRGDNQDVPLLLLAGNASIEWSNDLVAVLLGVSFPFGLYGKKEEATEGAVTGGSTSVTGLQPWTAAIGVSVSPF